MNPNLFESSLILAIAFLAVGAFALIVSVIFGRRRARRAFNSRFPVVVPQAPRPESAVDYARRTNYGMF